MWGAWCKPAQKGAVVDTSGTASTAGGGELWTTGQAADYLHDLGITRRQVSRMLDSGELKGIRRASGTWRRVRAADVRAYRERLLSQLADDQDRTPSP